MIIYTHQNVDLDAAFSAALLLCLHDLSIHSVAFLPANHNGEGLAETFLAVDIDLNGKGIKGGKVTSGNRTYVQAALLTILEDAPHEYILALKDIATYINALDSTGDWTTGYTHLFASSEELRKIPTLIDIFNAIKKIGGQADYADTQLVGLAKLIIEGQVLVTQSKLDSAGEAKRAKWPYPYIAIINEAKEDKTNTELMNAGAKFVIYTNGYNIGVVRSNAVVDFNLGDHLRDWFPEWFHHEGGFISCWGSKKSVATSPSDVDPQFLADCVYAAYENNK